MRLVAACLVGAVLLGGCAAGPPADVAPLPSTAPTTAAAAGAVPANGFGELPGVEILRRSRTALLHATSVHLIGYLATSDAQVAVDIRTARGRGGAGFMQPLNGPRIDLLRLGAACYARADAEFWENTGRTAAIAAHRGGRYARLRCDDPDVGGMLAFTDLPSLAAELFHYDRLVFKGNHKMVRGVETVGVAAQGGPDTIYVALQGDPYPMQVVPRGGSGDDYALNFTEFGRPFPLALPPASQVAD